MIRAYAACAGEAAVEVLRHRLAHIKDVRTDCERSALLAGLLQVAGGSAEFAVDARETLGRMLEGRFDSMRFGAAVTLLQAAHGAGLTGFAELAAALLERGRGDKYAKKHLLAWLEENHDSFMSVD